MADSCCARPMATIIKVGDFEAGIVGLEAALRTVYISGIEDEEQVQTELLQLAKQYGNYIAKNSEPDYRKALLREYRKFVLKTKQEAHLK